MLKYTKKAVSRSCKLNNQESVLLKKKLMIGKLLCINPLRHLLLILLGSFYGCSVPPSGDYEHEESYKIDYPSTQIKAEYSSYYFLVNETRNIFVYGLHHDPKFRTVWADNDTQAPGLITSSPTTIGDGEDKNDDDNSYTAPISIKLNKGTSQYGSWFKIYGGNKPNISTYSSEIIKSIFKREYNINFSCMIGYNLFDINNSYSYKTKEYVENAFNDANTKFNINTQSNNLTPTVLNIPDGLLLDILEEYIEKNIPGGDIGQLNKNTVWFFSVKNHNNTNEYASVKGITLGARNNNNEKLKFSFIFVESISHGDPMEQKQAVTSTVIHELGHARGMEFLLINGYCCDGDITDFPAHKKGHNGKMKNICVMRSRNMYDPDYTDDRYKNTIKNPRFCSGHLQMLFNVNW